MMRLLVLPLVVLAGACADPSTPGDPAREGAPPNLVWITIDTLRADRLGCYGYIRETSPRIDALAAESLLFERAWTPMATTLPSHLSALTATYPLEHGVLGNVSSGSHGFLPSEGLRSLAEVLQENGYDTAGFVSATPLKTWSGIDRGFTHYDDPGEENMRSAGETNDRVLAWLAARDDEPFFLWVHYFDPHAPYEAPAPFADAFGREGDTLDAYLSERAFAEVSLTPRDVEVNTREANDAYDGEVLYTDSEVGHLLDALAERGAMGRTAIVLNGDHGEGLGQHAWPRHGGFWAEHLAIPLLIRAPGIAGRRVATPISLVDVFPTLLGQVTLPGAERFLSGATGIDVLAAPPTERLLFSQTSKRLERFGGEEAHALTGTRWKYVQSEDGRQRLFDLQEDPFELNDVSAEHPDVVRNLAAELRAAIERFVTRAAELGPGGETSLAPELIEELRALGYLGDE